MGNEKRVFTYNNGNFQTDVELAKVTHIDLDNVLTGIDLGIFVAADAKGFIYLRDGGSVVDAYKGGYLYAISGNY